MRSGSTSGCCSSTSRRAGEIPEVLRERVRAGGDRVHEVEVAAVLVGRVPVGPFAEAAQVGREHDVAALGELVRVVAVVRGDRGAALLVAEAAHLRLARAVTVLREDRRRRAAVRSCGTSRNAGHRHRRFAVEHDRLAPVRAAVDDLAHLEVERDAVGHRTEQRVEPRAAPLAPRGDRRRIVDRARIARDEPRRGAASSRPTARSCAPVRSRGGDGTVRTWTRLRGCT